MKKTVNNHILRIARDIKPFNVSWHITDRCNYNCQFCFRPVHGNELNLAKAKKVIDRLVEAGLKKISWSGGEPMLWKGIIDLIEYTKSKGIITMLITNGELLTKRRLDRLEKCLDWLNLPLEGSNAKMNELMTRKKGHFDRVIKLLERVKKKKIKLKINTVASRLNKDDIENIIPIIKDYRIKRWKLFQFYPVRWIGKRNMQLFALKESDFLRIKEVILPMIDKDKCMVVFETNSDMDRSYFAIAPDAEVYVSHNYRDYFIGNLLKDDPKDIFNHPILDKVKYWERSRWLTRG